MQQELTADIQEVMDRAASLKKEPGVDKKAINKVIGRLEEAWLWSRVIIKPDSLNNPANMASLADKAPGCTCPAGVIDRDCPVHGGQP